MEDSLKQCYMQFFSETGPLAGPIIHVAAILIVACIAWWVSNRVLGKIEKKYHDRPFFEKNDSLFVLLKIGRASCRERV